MARSPKALMADSRIPLNSNFLTRIKVSRVPEPLVPLNSNFLTGSSANSKALPATDCTTRETQIPRRTRRFLQHAK